MKKIALICTEKLPVPPVAGGAVQLYIDGILPEVSRHYETTVFCVQHQMLPPEETLENVTYVRVPAPNKASYLANIKSRLTPDFDMIFVFNRPLWISHLSDGLPEVSFGLSLHNEMFLPEKISDKQALDCINRVGVINTVSSFIADGVAARFPQAASKLNVIHSGVDVKKYAPVFSPEGIDNKKRLKELLGIQDHKVILFVGRLSNKKGVDILIKAVQKVMETHKNVALAIVGSKWFGRNESDEYTVSLEKLAANLKGPVVFTGFLPPVEIPPYYNIGDVFVCPSQWNEPLARVHYEAMAAGLPILTTNRGGNAEVIERGENGLVLDDIDAERNCGSPQYMADYIEFLLDNPSIALSIGQKGRKLAEEKYSWKRVSRDFLNSLEKGMLYKPEVIQEPAAPPEADVPSKNRISENRSFEKDYFEFDF